MKNLVLLLVLVGGAYAIFNAYKAHQEESKEARTVRSLPPSVQHVVAQMDGASQAAFFNEYERKKKRKSVGWVLWFLFGWHYFYVRKIGIQFIYWLTLGGFGVWILVDLFRMPSIIREANEQSAREALQTLHMGVAFASMAPSASLAVQPVPPVAPMQGFAPPNSAHAASPVPQLSQAQASWQPDPFRRHELRWWNGTEWTDHVTTRGNQSTDPAR